MRIFSTTILLIFAFATYAAGGPPPNKAKPDAEELLQQILQLNQDLSCDSSEDCTSVALGASGCGKGPAGYLVVSKRNVHYEKIVERAKLHEAISKENNVLNGSTSMGTCSVAVPTTTVCDRKKCIEALL